MTKASLSTTAFVGGARRLFTTRNIIFHDGRSIRRFRIGGKHQAALLAAGALTIGFSSYGAVTALGVVGSETNVEQMQTEVAQLQTRVAAIRQVAAAHAERVEQRQALIAAALTGQGDARRLAMATLAVEGPSDRLAQAVVAPLARIEARQFALAGSAQSLLERRYAQTAATLRKLGLRPERVAKASPAMGGEYIPANSAEAAADMRADQQFKTLFQTWKKLDSLQQGVIAIPSVQPVTKLQFTSNFGIRSDPFRGTAAMHAGVDIPGPTGTPIYATADGIVANADRQGGYGNMVEINHGKGIATRYGHLSRILVANGTRVHRGQLIALMGSTGRSTGPHLHYEVRIDGHAVNPIPFLTTADYLLAAQDQAVRQIPVTTEASQD